jgi:hypothetical protein
MYVLNDPQYWHMQAEEMATLANGMEDHVTRQAMRRIASELRSARKARERTTGKGHSRA